MEHLNYANNSIGNSKRIWNAWAK